jgi:ankyrin repeat protein
MAASGSMPMPVAAARKIPADRRILIAAGAEVNARGEPGHSLLHEAAAEGHREVVELLLAHGASPNSTNDNGLAPSELAPLMHHEHLSGLLQAVLPIHVFEPTGLFLRFGRHTIIAMRHRRSRSGRRLAFRQTDCLLGVLIAAVDRRLAWSASPGRRIRSQGIVPESGNLVARPIHARALLLSPT